MCPCSAARTPYSQSRSRQLLYRVLVTEVTVVLLVLVVLNVTATWTFDYIPLEDTVSLSIVISQGFVCMWMLKILPVRVSASCGRDFSVCVDDVRLDAKAAAAAAVVGGSDGCARGVGSRKAIALALT
jgi:hypothetical protein